MPLVRDTWIPVFGSAMRLALVLAVLGAVVRGVGMLGPPAYFWVLPAGFVVMALSLHLFFRRDGRRRAGLRLPRKAQWLVWGMVLGVTASLLIYALGVALFGDSSDNWYVSVRRSFPIDTAQASLSTATAFWIVSIPPMIFSPLGEEIFFRGFLQQAAEERWDYRTAVIIDAGWFAAVHLFHHGIVRIDGRLEVLPLSGALWVVLIFGVGVMFAFVRRKAGSLLAPILSHAAFNVGMNFTILYWL